MAASATEQLQLELINEARLNPAASFARYITSFSPLTATQTNIQNNFDSWGVSGSALQAAINALQPVQPLAWNDSLANAARTHSTNMGAANQQTHNSLNGEAVGMRPDHGDDPGARISANGYGSLTAWGENIAAASDDSIEILASLMVDWGPGTNGMQSPPGHRNNIMGIDDQGQPIQSTFREVGIGIANVTVQSNVGPLAVTEDFATHGSSGAFILGVAYNDSDNNKFYSVGEGLSSLAISVTGGASTTSAAAGGYSLFTTTVGAAQHITFTGGGLSSAVDFLTPLANGQNLKIDIVNGNTLKTSVSGTITGPVTRVEALGIVGLSLTTGAGSQTIVGTKGNDTIDGGAATDTVVFSGNKAAYTLTALSGNGVQVSGPDGVDTLSNVEILQFADQSMTWPPAGSVAGSISINDIITVEGDSGTHVTTFTITRSGGTAAFDVNFATSDGSATTADNDYVAKSGTVHFNAGVTTQPINITIIGDAKVEPNQTFSVTLSGATNGATISDGTGVATIANDDVQRFSSPSLALAAYGTGASAGGWSSEHTFPREVADVSGDGLADIIGFGSDGAYVSLATGGGHFAAPILGIGTFGAAASAGGWSNNTIFPRELADVNGDGFADIVGFGSDGAYVSLASGGGHFLAPILGVGAFGAGASGGGWSNSNIFPREMGDVNADGKADIVGFGTDGVYVALATSAGHFAAPFLARASFGAGPGAGGWSNDDLFPREVADVNGDGFADIVGFGTDGVYVSLATGGGHFLAPTLALGAFGAGPGAGGWSSQHQFPRELADVNGDHRADIIAFGNDGVYIALGQIDGTFGPVHADVATFGAGASAGGWSSNDIFPRILADVTGDHRADIVGFGSDGVYVSPEHDFLLT